MPSWQARLLSTFMRFYFKRPSAAFQLGEEDKVVTHIRKKLEPPKFLLPPLPRAAKVTPVNAGGLRGEWVEFTDDPQCMIYYLHGGGYVACSPETYRSFTLALSKACNARVFALDYRRAPEHRFPAALEDAVAGYKWLLANGECPEKIIIAGDSAGGGLTIATLVALRDQGVELPSAAFCLSPWTDLAGTGSSRVENDDKDPMFYGSYTRNFATIYLGDAAPDDPLASPLYADLRGLPPLQMYVGSTEVLLDDSTRLAERARASGVEVELCVKNEMIHVWPIFIGLGLPEARATISEIAAFTKRQLARPQPESKTSAARPGR